MTSARSVVLYLFAVLATLAGLALRAPGASGCSRVPTADSPACYQHFQNASFPVIAGHIASQRLVARSRRSGSAAGTARMGVAFDRLMSNEKFAGVERRDLSARKARGATC
jgi:hypothetical protein